MARAGDQQDGSGELTVSTHIVITFGIVLAAIGMVLSVLSAATAIRHSTRRRHAGGRSHGRGAIPLHAQSALCGGWFMMAAFSLLLTPSGALLMVVLIGIFYLRLIYGEEAFLTAKLGEPFTGSI